MTDGAHVTGIFIYPVKSTAGIGVNETVVERRGLSRDRRWVVADVSGKFLTGRENPKLVKIRAVPQEDRLLLSAPGMSEIEVPIPNVKRPRRTVQVWNDRCEGLPAGTETDNWLSDFLGVQCQLIYMDAECVRPLGSGGDGSEVSFADNSPMLLISSASLEDLNGRLPEPTDMRRFRPNLVAGGTQAYAEDRWQRIRIGEAVFEALDQCDRCAFTTIDPDSGEKHPRQEPLRSLSRYRRGVDGGVYFGRNLIPERLGRVRIGDKVEILA